MSDILAIRKRPGMYVGLAENRLDFHQLVTECISSAIVDARQAAAPQIDVVLHADGSCSVSDNGPGLWNRPSSEPGRLVGERILTDFVAGIASGFDDPQEAGGLISSLAVVNALSERLSVRLRTHGIEHKCAYRRGVRQDAATSTPCAADASGTTIHFLPDETLFGSAVFDADVISRRMLPLTFFLPAGILTLTDARAPVPSRVQIGL
ncbi:MAG: ATP-binding protein [Micropepsaceae bacterium]